MLQGPCSFANTKGFQVCRDQYLVWQFGGQRPQLPACSDPHHTDLQHLPVTSRSHQLTTTDGTSLYEVI